MQKPTLPEVGDTIAGKYRIERVLGEGGMGIVYQALHTELLQGVAIKVLLPHVATHRTAAERFRREARAAAAMRGEHVCRVLDVGTLNDELPFMVMEYLEGRDLAEELREQGPLRTTDAVDYLLQACEALAEAHGAGIVHRDLKPANLFLTRRSDGSRRIKVLDFGVSKALSDDSSSELGLTNTSTMVGSPLYMSPEQLDSARGVDSRTDIWALGVVLYELLSGAPPFGGTSIPQLVSAVLHDEPVSISSRGISVPIGLEQVIDRALAKNRDHRFASVVELAQALTPYGTAASSQTAARAARVMSLSAAGLAESNDGYRDRPTAAQLSASFTSTGATGSTGARGWSGKTSTPATGDDGTPMGWQREEGKPKRAASRLVFAGALIAVLLGGGYLLASRDNQEPAADDGGPPASPLPKAAAAPLPGKRLGSAPATNTSGAVKGSEIATPAEVEAGGGTKPQTIPDGIEPVLDGALRPAGQATDGLDSAQEAAAAAEASRDVDVPTASDEASGADSAKASDTAAAAKPALRRRATPSGAKTGSDRSKAVGSSPPASSGGGANEAAAQEVRGPAAKSGTNNLPDFGGRR